MLSARQAFVAPGLLRSGSFDPLAAFDWKAAFYAGDPLWTPPADGDPVAAWKNGGSTRSEGAYLSTGAGLVLPGTVGNYASVPDEAALDITGDLEIRATFTVGAYSGAQFVLSKNLAAYEVYLSSGDLKFVAGGSEVTASVALSTVFSAGELSRIKITYRDSDKRVQFFTSADGETWAQLGSDKTIASAPTATAFTLNIGYRNGGGTFPLAGTIRSAQVYNGIAGTKVLDVDFARADTNKFTCSTGQTVTVHNTLDASQATGTKQPAYRASVAALNGKPAVQGDGVDDFLQTAAWSSALSQPWSLVLVAAIDAPGAASRYITDGLDATHRAVVGRENADGKWRASTGTQRNSTEDSDGDAHLFVLRGNNAANPLLIYGSAVTFSGTVGTHEMSGLTMFNAYTGSSTPSAGHLAFAGAIAGDITAEANWPAFVAWVETHYGLVIA